MVTAVIGLMVVANVIFGLHGNGPSLEIVPDPAGGLDLPF
jgi:hypothetical protein